MNYLSQVAATLIAAAVLVACGGGEFDSAAMAAVLPGAGVDTETPSRVRVEGCVVDADGRPLALAVQASASDGRLLASVTSDATGVFRMQVPARQSVRLQTAAPGAAALSVLTGTGAMTVTGCLRASA